MANGKDHNPKHGDLSLSKLVGILVVALGSAIAAISFLVQQVTVQVDAPDRYTGEQAEADQARNDAFHESINRQLEAIREKDRELQRQLEKLPPRKLTDRVLEVEFELRELRKDVEACCKQ